MYDILAPATSSSSVFDAKTYDGMIDDAGTLTGLIYLDAQPTTLVPPRPVRQDTGVNPHETRPESGDIFSQGDFSGGSGQEKAHEGTTATLAERARRYYDSDGIDISVPGRMKPLYRCAEAHNSTGVGRMTQAGGLPYVTDGNDVVAGDGNFAGTWSEDEDFALAANDIVAEGARIYAAVNSTTAPLRVRSAAGSWTTVQLAATDVTLEDSSGGTTRAATNLLWYRGRLIAVTTRGVFEIAGADATPGNLNVLAEGWEYQRPWSSGTHLNVPAVNVDAGLSEVWHFGLNSSGTFTVLSYTPIDNMLVYCGRHTAGVSFFAGGTKNQNTGGVDPVVFRATPGEDGVLENWVKIADEVGAGTTDLSVRAITSVGERVFLGWSLTATSRGLTAREGIAVYNLARDSFAKHLRKTTAAATPARIADIMVYKGRVLFTVNGDGLYYEDIGTYMASSTFTSSFGTWSNAGQKTWSRVDAAFRPLPNGASLDFDYTTKSFPENNWTDTGSDATAAGAESYTQALTNVNSDKFALRINFTANGAGTDAPELISFSVRSDPKPTAEFRFTRTVRILRKDRKEGGRWVHQDPKIIRKRLMDLAYKWVTLTEPDASWSVRIEDFQDIEPEQPIHSSTLGTTAPDEGYIVKLTFQGTRTS